MVQRQIDSRQSTASRSLMSRSFADAQRLRKEPDAWRRPAGHGFDDGARRKLGESHSSPALDAGPVQDFPSTGSGRKPRAGKQGRSRGRKVRTRNSLSRLLRPKGSRNRKSGRRKSAASSKPPPPPPPPIEVIVEFSEDQVDRLREVFDLMDADHSGLVSQREMMVALRTNAKVTDFVKNSKLLAPLLHDSDFARTFMEMDPDQDGGISFEEFVHFMQEHSSEEAVIADIAERGASPMSGGQDGSLLTTPSPGLAPSVIKSRENGAILERIFMMARGGDSSSNLLSKRDIVMAVKGVPAIREFVVKYDAVSQVLKNHEYLGMLEREGEFTNEFFVASGLKFLQGTAKNSAKK